jgi:hypothetical protein
MHLGLHVLRKLWSSAAIGTSHERGQNLSLPQSRITHPYNTVSPLADALAQFSVCAVWSSAPSYTPLLSHFLCPQSSLPHTDEAAAPPRTHLRSYTSQTHSIVTVPSFRRAGRWDKIAVGPMKRLRFDAEVWSESWERELSSKSGVDWRERNRCAETVCCAKVPRHAFPFPKLTCT